MNVDGGSVCSCFNSTSISTVYKARWEGRAEPQNLPSPSSYRPRQPLLLHSTSHTQMKAVFRPPPGVCSYTSFHLGSLRGLELLPVRLWEPSESTILVETAAAGESQWCLLRRALRVSPGVSGFNSAPTVCWPWLLRECHHCCLVPPVPHLQAGDDDSFCRVGYLIMLVKQSNRSRRR